MMNDSEYFSNHFRINNYIKNNYVADVVTVNILRSLRSELVIT